MSQRKRYTKQFKKEEALPVVSQDCRNIFLDRDMLFLYCQFNSHLADWAA